MNRIENAGSITKYAYDAAGNRINSTFNAGTANEKQTNYLVNDAMFSQVMEERDENNVLQKRYDWSDGLAPLKVENRTASGSYQSSYFLWDNTSSTRQLTDENGNVTDSLFYDAFGNTQAGGQGNTPNNLKLNSQEQGADGLYYLRARFYNPGTGRFLSEDPLLGSD